MSRSKPGKKLKILIIIVIIAVALLVVMGVVGSGYFSAANYARVDFDKYVELGEYEGLTYSVDVKKVTDADVQEVIQSDLDSAGTEQKVTSGTVKNGDKITITYTGTIDGKAFDGSSATNLEVTVGDKNLMDAFNEGLIGKKVGSKFKLSVTFPSNHYVSEYAGKTAIYTVEINSKTETRKATYDEDFVKNNTEYDSKADYEAAIRKELEEDAKLSAEDAAKLALWKKVHDASKVNEYPEAQLEYEKTQFDKSYEETAAAYGMSLDEFKDAIGMTDDTWESERTSSAEASCKEKLIVYALAEKTGVRLSNREYKNYLNKMLENAGITEEQFESQYNMTIEEYGESNDLRTSCLLDKVCDKLMELGKSK